MSDFGDDFGAYSDDDAFDDEFDDDAEISTELPLRKEYTVLNPDEIIAQLNDVVTDFASLVDLPRDVACILLRSHRWNKEQLIAKFFDARSKTLREAGLLSFDVTHEPKKGQLKCGICLTLIDAAETFGLSCKHNFCHICWDGYLKDKIKQGVISLLLKCPMFKCKLVVRDDIVRKLVSAEMYEKHQTVIARSFVEDNRTARWCPAPGCEFAVKSVVAASSLKNVKCSCGMNFCFQCNEESHEPVNCDQLQLWLEKCKNESETAHWIIANTKRCPKCAVRIEKAQGCNHMNCRSCKHEFCWVCMGPWEEHGNHTGGFYQCNKYDPKRKKQPATKKADKSTNGDSKQEAKAELDRYLHYYQRYHNHDQSKRFAAKLAADTEARMRQMQEQDSESTWIDWQYLKAATDLVSECRSVLKYTYVFGYYLEDGPEKELFEFLQQELEKNTEQLSEISESDPGKAERAEVVNHTRITEKFMSNLLEGVQNGLTQ